MGCLSVASELLNIPLDKSPILSRIGIDAEGAKRAVMNAYAYHVNLSPNVMTMAVDDVFAKCNFPIPIILQPQNMELSTCSQEYNSIMGHNMSENVDMEII